jgi:hypothetical protein
MRSFLPPSICPIALDTNRDYSSKIKGQLLQSASRRQHLSLLTEAILFFVRLSKLLAGIERFKGEVVIVEVEVVQIDGLISTGCSLATPYPAQGEAANSPTTTQPPPTLTHNERAGESDPQG